VSSGDTPIEAGIRGRDISLKDILLNGWNKRSWRDELIGARAIGISKASFSVPNKCGAAIAGKMGRQLEEFLENVRLLHEQVGEMEGDAGRIEKERMKILEGIPGKEEAAEEELERLVDKFYERSKSTTEKIEELREESRKKGGGEKDVVGREMHISSLYARVKRVVEKVVRLEEEFIDTEAERIRAKYRIKREDVSEEGLEGLSEREKRKVRARSLFNVGGLSEEDRQSLEKRGKNIEDLLEDLHSLILLNERLNQIISCGDESVDRVTVKIKKSRIESAEANKDLEGGIKYKRGKKKLKLVFMVLVGFVLLILFTYLLSLLYGLLKPFLKSEK
jgi:t-SNARE complex subunit (syntaxin)